jgi:large subunit ribosomal protein L13e
MVKHNNALPSTHLRKHWDGYVRTWFNQPARKIRRANNRKDKGAKIFPRPIEKLRPLVSACSRKYNTKIRYGRGFTLTELKAAKLNARFAQSVGIAVDHRRVNTSEECLQRNSQRLEQYKSKLILFPRRDGKFKQGMIADSTADKLKAADQNTDKHLMAKPAQKHRSKPVKITKEMQALKAYRRLRIEKTNQKWKGLREKKAKEVAEKAK